MNINFDNVSDEAKALNVKFFCASTREAIDEIFAEYEITDLVEKISILEEVMGVEKTYGVGYPEGDKTQIEYNSRVELFLDGIWRIL